MEENMQQDILIRFNNLSSFDNLVHFSSTRQGGVSTGSYASLNLSYFSGDLSSNVDKNRQIAAVLSGIMPGNLYVPYQVHSNQIGFIEKDFLTSSAEEQMALLHGKDAVITGLKGICIGITTADCVPVLLYDPVKKITAAIHAGWRGTCKRIVEKTLQGMDDRYGCSPENVYAAIGPSIGPNAFETGKEVYAEFRKENFNMERISFLNPDSGKYYINLREANLIQLIDLGLRKENIEVSGLCTYMHPERFFSARREGILSGRMITAIGLK